MDSFQSKKIGIYALAVGFAFLYLLLFTDVITQNLLFPKTSTTTVGNGDEFDTGDVTIELSVYARRSDMDETHPGILTRLQIYYVFQNRCGQA